MSKYHTLALRALSSTTSGTTANNFFAIFNFSRLMTLCCIAGVQMDKLMSGEPATSITHMLPEWFPVQLEGRKLIWPHRGGGRIIAAMHGPYEALRTSDLMPNHGISSNPLDSHLGKLAVSLSRLPRDHVDESCLEALDVLRRVWANPHRNAANSFRDAALMWPVRVPPRYLALTENRDYAALIVFAHYWVLWSQSEGIYWYMRGHSKTMLMRIVQKLPANWLPWIEWPVSMILGPNFRRCAGSIV